MNRREFLQTSAAVSAALSASQVVAAPKDEWAALRSQFLLTRDRVHATSFLFSTHPKVVRDAIDKHRQGFDLDPATYLHENEVRLDDEVRKAAAAYLEVPFEQLAFTDSTTMGLGLVYGSLKLGKDHEVLTTTHDHYSTQTSFQYRVARDGITVKTIPLYDAPETATADGMTQAIVKAVTPKTRLVAITWVHSGTGVKTPVRQIADALKTLNEKRPAADRILLAVDGVHGFASEETTLPALGCDVFISGCHKWLFGPRGTGFFYASPEVTPLLQPSIPPFSEQYGVWLGFEVKQPLPLVDVMTPGGFHSFEYRFALAEAFRWHQQLGKAKVAARIHALNRQFKEGAVKIPGLTLHTPMADELSSGINTFELDGLKPDEVVKQLRAQKIDISSTPYKTVYARASFGILNSPQDVDATLKALRNVRA